MIDLNLIDENSDKAFRTFFNEDDDDVKKVAERRSRFKKNKNKENIELKESKKDKDENSVKANVKLTAAAIICALLVAVIGGIIGFRAIMYVPEVTVPDLIGKNEEEAQKIIEDLKLVFKVENREYNSDYEEGEIIEQSQEEGTKLKENFPVEVIISKGSKNIEVPNLIGSYAIEATVILADMGLKEGSVTEKYSPTAPKGEIIEQSPDAKTPAILDDKVDYVVSIGLEVKYATMPNLVGHDIETAKAKIIQNGLTVGQITEENSDDTAAGLVMKQSVPTGQGVEEGSSIWMTVSKGPLVPEEPPISTENPSVKTYPLTITLPTDKATVLVVVQKVSSDSREIIYSKEVNTSEQSIIINVEGTGTQVFEIYIDNTLYDRAEITFK